MPADTSSKGDKDRVNTATLYSLMAQSKTYDDRIELGRGDPDFDTPDHIVKAFERGMRDASTTYSPIEGILPLRRAISNRLRRVNGIDLDPGTDIVVTNGAQEAVFITVQAILAPGDEILVPDPNYNTYRDAIRFARAKRVSVPTYLGEDFRVVPERMEAAITENTRAMLLASPNNPTAAVISPDDVWALTKIAREHDLIIVADDIYDRFLYGAEHLSPASLDGVAERTLTLNSVSKQYAMCGWRLGWVAGPKDLIGVVREVKASVTGWTPVMAQQGALAALDGPDDCILKMQKAYSRRRQTVLDGLDALGFDYGMPQGGQFVFADISRASMSSVEFVKWVLEECHVLIYPGGAFGSAYDNFIRITFLQPNDLLVEAFERLKNLVKRQNLGG